MIGVAGLEEMPGERASLKKSRPMKPEPAVVANHPGAVRHLETFNFVAGGSRTRLDVTRHLAGRRNRPAVLEVTAHVDHGWPGPA
jgi:hypothetical protein